MDIHKPKAAHSWREFLIEIATIICGILIALSLEQGVEWLHKQERLAKAQEDLNGDVMAGVGLSLERSAVEPCLRNRIRELAQSIRAPHANWHAPPPPPGASSAGVGFSEPALPIVYRHPARNWRTTAWEAARTDGSVALLPHAAQIEYGRAFRAIEQLREANAEESKISSQLKVLGFDTQFSTPEKNAILEILGRLDDLNYIMSGMSNQLRLDAERLHLKIDVTLIRSQISSAQTRYGQCVRMDLQSQLAK